MQKNNSSSLQIQKIFSLHWGLDNTKKFMKPWVYSDAKYLVRILIDFDFHLLCAEFWREK